MVVSTANSVRRVVLAGFFLISTFAANLYRQANAQTLTGHPYIEASKVNLDTCLRCHPDKEEGKFVHSAIDNGCETCHQVVSAEKEEKTSITLLAEGGELCAMCHEAKPRQVAHGPYKSGNCTICHEPHSSQFPAQLRADENTLCDSCHEANSSSAHIDREARRVELLGKQPYPLADYDTAPKMGTLHSPPPGATVSTHPVAGTDHRKRSIVLKCSSCHDPHASDVSKLLRKAAEGRETSENLCLSCHPELLSQIHKKIQHAAVDMGCRTCHTVHTSQPSGKPEGVFHLVQGQPDLCLTCHDATDAAIQKAHLGQPFATSRCTECHNPHGSDRAKLINNFVHPPFEEKACDTCHSEPKDGKIVLNEGARRDLCLACHPKVQESLATAKFVHAALEKDTGCVSCHTPHAATYVHQTRRRSVELCLTCHTRQSVAWQGKEYIHPPAFEISCAVCHHPHVGESRRRVRAEDVNKLCLECHGKQMRSRLQAGGTVELFGGTVKVDATALAGLHLLPIGLEDTRGHPVANHPVSDGDKINCITCHSPHAADGSMRRFVTETKTSTQLCVNCHKK